MNKYLLPALMTLLMAPLVQADYATQVPLTLEGEGPWYRLELPLSLQGVVSGETKGNDTVDGDTVEGSAETDVYCGPALSFSWESNLAAEVAVDIPFVSNASGVALVPDYRIRAALSWQF